MCWMCDHPGSTIEDYLDELRSTILEHGWAVQFVESDRTPYAYTIGLHDCGLPELLVTGLPPQRAARLLNRVAEMTTGTADGHGLPASVTAEDGNRCSASGPSKGVARSGRPEARSAKSSTGPGFPAGRPARRPSTCCAHPATAAARVPNRGSGG